MATLTIFCGLPKPIKAVGKNQVKLLDFAYKYNGWHSYSLDKPTIRAVSALHKKGYLALNEFNQFKFTYPRG